MSDFAGGPETTRMLIENDSNKFVCVFCYRVLFSDTG